MCTSVECELPIDAVGSVRVRDRAPNGVWGDRLKLIESYLDVGTILSLRQTCSVMYRFRYRPAHGTFDFSGFRGVDPRVIWESVLPAVCCAVPSSVLKRGVILDFSKCSLIKDTDVAHLMDWIHGTAADNSLEINIREIHFDFCYDITDEGLSAMLTTSLPHLTRLSLKCIRNPDFTGVPFKTHLNIELWPSFHQLECGFSNIWLDPMQAVSKVMSNSSFEKPYLGLLGSWASKCLFEKYGFGAVAKQFTQAMRSGKHAMTSMLMELIQKDWYKLSTLRPKKDHLLDLISDQGCALLVNAPMTVDRLEDSSVCVWTLPLSVAIQAGDLGLLRILLSGGAKVCVWDHMGKSPLYRACECEQTSMVQLLLENMESVSNISDLQVTFLSPLVAAIRKSNLKILNLLIDKGASVEMDAPAIQNYRSPLYVACSEKASDTVIQTLLEQGGNPFWRVKETKYSPILIAFQVNPDLLCTLLDCKGARDVLHIEGQCGSPVCMHSSIYTSPQVHSCSINYKRCTSCSKILKILHEVLSCAIMKADLHSVKLILDRFPTLLNHSHGAWSLPHIQTAKLGLVFVLKYILEFGGTQLNSNKNVLENSNVQDTQKVVDSQNMLENSDVLDNDNVLENLSTEKDVLENKNVLEKNVLEKHVLESLNTEKNILENEIVLENLNTEKNVIENDNVLENLITEKNILENENVLENLSTEKNVFENRNVLETEDVLENENVLEKNILEKNNLVEKTNIENKSVVVEKTNIENKTVVEKSKKKMKNDQIESTSVGKFSMDFFKKKLRTVEIGKEKVRVKERLSGGEEVVCAHPCVRLDVNAAGPDGVTALHVACEEGWTDCAELLIQHGCDINKTTIGYGLTALHIACLENRMQTGRLLVGASCDVNIRCLQKGETSLMTCIKTRNEAMATMILKEHSVPLDLNIVDCKGRSALQYAVFYGQYVVAETIARKGCDLNLTDPCGNSAWTMINEKFDNSHADRKTLKKLLHLLKQYETQLPPTPTNSTHNSSQTSNTSQSPLPPIVIPSYTQIVTQNWSHNNSNNANNINNINNNQNNEDENDTNKATISVCSTTSPLSRSASSMEGAHRSAFEQARPARLGSQERYQYVNGSIENENLARSPQSALKDQHKLQNQQQQKNIKASPAFADARAAARKKPQHIVGYLKSTLFSHS